MLLGNVRFQRSVCQLSPQLLWNTHIKYKILFLSGQKPFLKVCNCCKTNKHSNKQFANSFEVFCLRMLTDQLVQGILIANVTEGSGYLCFLASCTESTFSLPSTSRTTETRSTASTMVPVPTVSV